MVDQGLVVCKKTCLYEMLNIVEKYKDGLEYIEKRKEWPRGGHESGHENVVERTH